MHLQFVFLLDFKDCVPNEEEKRKIRTVLKTYDKMFYSSTKGEEPVYKDPMKPESESHKYNINVKKHDVNDRFVYEKVVYMMKLSIW